MNSSRSLTNACQKKKKKGKMPNAKRQTPNPNSALDPFLQFIKKRKKEKKKTSLLLQIIFM